MILFKDLLNAMYSFKRKYEQTTPDSIALDSSVLEVVRNNENVILNCRINNQVFKVCEYSLC